MPRIAVIQDGTEVARQRFADVADRFEACCQRLSTEGLGEFTTHVFTDEATFDLFDGLDSGEWQCVAFASNALLSGQVETALGSARDDIRRYISSGGGIIVLHQQRESLSPLLPAALLPKMTERTAPRGSAFARAVDPEDILLHYPLAVEWAVLRDFGEQEMRDAPGGSEGGSELPSLFFKSLDRRTLPSALKTVLDAPTGEVVLARTGDHVTERVVISTMPLDWQFERPGQGAQTAALLTNALRYGAVGAPRRLVWRRERQESNPLLIRWLATDGAAALRTAPAAERSLDPTESWLLSAVGLFVLPEDRRSWVEEEEVVERFLAAGGTLVAAADVAPGLTRVTAVIGRYEEQALAARLYAELRAVDGWRSVDNAFELRNIVAVLSFLHGNEIDGGDTAAALLEELLPLVQKLEQRLADPKHREDIGSSIALAETLALLNPDTELSKHVGWLSVQASRCPFDVALQIRSVLALATGQQASTFLEDAADAFEGAAGQATSLASLVRILESVDRLAQRRLLDDERDQAARLAESACSLLEATSPYADRAWMSVEATAHLTRGLVALHTRLPEDSPDLRARVAGHVATGATALRAARRRYERNAKGVAWLSCVVHSIVVADRVFPIGLQRLASLEWPEGTDASSPVERALLQQLAVANEELRLSERDLQQRLDDQLQQRLAASIGRGTATLIPAALLIAAAAIVIWQVGWKSLGGLLLSIAALSTLALTALGLIFAALARLHLLAGPAPRIRRWIDENAVPALKTAGGIKRG